jgi:hypothetical protein
MRRPYPILEKILLDRTGCSPALQPATIETVSGVNMIYYDDRGAGQPVFFSHGWPLNSDAGDDQSFFGRHVVSASPLMTVASA